MKLIAYYRVSTAEQGHSRLGLEAQREAVHRYAVQMGAVIRAEFEEVQSSRRDRPQFEAALVMCQQYGDTLTVARLDRLSRDLHTITSLQKSKVDFLAVDNPGASKFMVQILGAVAENERDMISARTAAALARAKAKGTRLGAPDPVAAIAAVTLARSTAAEEFRLLHRAGMTYQAIADQYTTRGVPTPSGSAKWNPNHVRRILEHPTGLNLGPIANDEHDPNALPLFVNAGVD